MKSMAVRYSIFLSLSIFLIFFIYFIITLAYSVQIIAEDTRKNTENLTELTLSRLTNALSRVEQMPLILVKSLAEPSPDYYEILRILQGIVLDDPYIFGTCILLNHTHFTRIPSTMPSIPTKVRRGSGPNISEGVLTIISPKTGTGSPGRRASPHGRNPIMILGAAIR